MRRVDDVHPLSVRDMTNAYNITDRAYPSDCKGGTIRNNNVQQGAGAISSPQCYKK